MTPWDFVSYTLPWGVVLLTSLAGAVTDLHARRVPNRLTFPVLLGGLLWATYEGGAAGLADAAGACVLLALPFVLLFVLANGGAGDAKLMGALGAWLGVARPPCARESRQRGRMPAWSRPRRAHRRCPSRGSPPG